MKKRGHEDNDRRNIDHGDESGRQNNEVDTDIGKNTVTNYPSSSTFQNPDVSTASALPITDDNTVFGEIAVIRTNR